MESVQIDRLLPPELPDWREIVRRGQEIAREIKVPSTLFREQHGVKTEEEYRWRAAKEGQILGQMNIGLRTWRETAEAVAYVHRETAKRGFDMHIFNVLVDRRMGLPPEMRARAPQETGPMLECDADWAEVGRVAPIEPHMSDFMIGSPASVVNTVAALSNGLTYMGNLSQFYWRYPYYDDDVAQMSNMVQALSIMAAKRDDGAAVASYLDDGYSGLFHDYTSVVGIAMLERYLAEEILGAKLTINFGGLTYDPPTKAAVCLALERVNVHRNFTSYHHCNTIEYHRDITQNYAVLTLDMLFMAMVEKILHRRGWPGAALLPIAVTEAIRIPSPDEIVEAHTIMRRAAQDADRIIDYIDWDKIDGMADRLVEGAKRFFDNAMKTFASMGVDTTNPLAVWIALRRLGAAKVEELFGVGEPDLSFPRGMRPVVATDMLRQTMSRRSWLIEQLKTESEKPRLSGITVVAGSTDIHEYGIFLVKDTLKELGAKVVDAGLSVDPEDVAKVALETDAAALAISTHNGMALSYGKKLLEEMERLGVRARLVMGGTLNEPVEGSAMPVDVRDDLRGLGIVPCDEITHMVEAIEETRKAAAPPA